MVGSRLLSLTALPASAAGAVDHRRQGDALSAGVVRRRQADHLRRQGRRPTARRSPRSEWAPGTGDYVLAINGRELMGADGPYRLLRNAADNPVELLVNDKPDKQGARTISYRPVTDESKLI